MCVIKCLRKKNFFSVLLYGIWLVLIHKEALELYHQILGGITGVVILPYLPLGILSQQ